MNSKEKNQEKSLNYTQLLNNIPSAILVTDDDYNISFINYSAEVLLGESSKIILNNNLKNFLSLDNQLFSLIDQVNKQRYNATQFDITINDFNKRNFIVDVEAGIYDEKHIILCFHKRAIAEQIERSIVYKNIHSVSGLSSLMAHEIKNPLSGIKGAAQLLNEVVDGEDKDLTSLIIDEVDRIGELASRVNSISDNNIINKTILNIHDVLQRVNKIAKNSFAINCNIIEVYDPSLPEIYGDINSLIQVFLNLVKNAAEAKPDGEITIKTGYRHGFNIKVSGSTNKLKLPIYVQIKDDGPGIPESIKHHLFEPFVSSKHRGSGLGLSIVSSIIEEHGGIIEVNSSINTVFTILFPQFEDNN
ncbi:MAG: Nitrogen regulation protein NR(II) [Alphaproteobacteria bacterium MarineAlpha9_Bin3]|nr:MAG: Nitrogen regulation protein NR(II) [Alphaproteobacteria bacterium MarineAlpha9_Bin3]|tara:strand:+ start:47502 stop:48581 length:1080 start_codon:yes stop_codon:yes gene_type:complete